MNLQKLKQITLQTLMSYKEKKKQKFNITN